MMTPNIWTFSPSSEPSLSILCLLFVSGQCRTEHGSICTCNKVHVTRWVPFYLGSPLTPVCTRGGGHPCQGREAEDLPHWGSVLWPQCWWRLVQHQSQMFFLYRPWVPHAILHEPLFFLIISEMACTLMFLKPVVLFKVQKCQGLPQQSPLYLISSLALLMTVFPITKCSVWFSLDFLKAILFWFFLIFPPVTIPLPFKSFSFNISQCLSYFIWEKKTNREE